MAVGLTGVLVQVSAFSLAIHLHSHCIQKAVDYDCSARVPVTHGETRTGVSGSLRLTWPDTYFKFKGLEGLPASPSLIHRCRWKHQCTADNLTLGLLRYQKWHPSWIMLCFLGGSNLKKTGESGRPHLTRSESLPWLATYLWPQQHMLFGGVVFKLSAYF